jgi:sugar lactone lactonase YvrE
MPDLADDAGADGIEVSSDGRVFVATRIGIQVCDAAGRVQCILPTPNGKVANLALGGPELETLYALCGDKLYKRRVLAKAAHSFLPSVASKQNGG